MMKYYGAAYETTQPRMEVSWVKIETQFYNNYIFFCQRLNINVHLRHNDVQIEKTEESVEALRLYLILHPNLTLIEKGVNQSMWVLF